MLCAENLSRHYGAVAAVDGVSFTVGAGEIVGLLGHNGAGKTTIMKMLTGYLEPSGGRVRFDGVDIAADSSDLRRALGYLPENLPVYPEMSVCDFLDYSATLRGLRGAERSRAMARAVAQCDLGDKALAAIGTLSRGYRQRVGVAQAILHRPSLVILDEPTNGLDPGQTQHMRELIRELALDATVMLSTHIMQEVDAICSRALILRGGRLVVDEELDALRRSRSLALTTDADEAVIQRLSREVSGIDGYRQQSASEPARRLYHLQLAPDSELDGVAAAVADYLVKDGRRLFGLRAVSRDLETVFRAVAAGREEELNHAA